jgi:hypothetical protein
VTAMVMAFRRMRSSRFIELGLYRTPGSGPAWRGGRSRKTGNDYVSHASRIVDGDTPMPTVGLTSK